MAAPWVKACGGLPRTGVANLTKASGLRGVGLQSQLDSRENWLAYYERTQEYSHSTACLGESRGIEMHPPDYAARLEDNLFSELSAMTRLLRVDYNSIRVPLINTSREHVVARGGRPIQLFHCFKGTFRASLLEQGLNRVSYHRRCE